MMALVRRSLGRSAEEGGQALPLFLLMIFVVTGSIALVTDVSWFWVNQQKMQRAADAGALAGAVYLPDNNCATPPDCRAYTAAKAAAIENAYTDGSGGVTVTPAVDPSNKRRLGVTVSGPVDTFFARIIGLTQASITASSRAEFTLPVPMGSPQNYFGVGDFYTTTPTWVNTDVPDNQRQSPTTTTPASGKWTNPTFAYLAGVTKSTTASPLAQQWGGFGFQGFVPNDTTLVMDGFQVRLSNVILRGGGTSTGCQLTTALSWDGGTTWTTPQNTPNLSTTSQATVTVGSTTAMSGWGTGALGWGPHVWNASTAAKYLEFSNAKFQARLTWTNGSGACANTRSVDVDTVEVQAYWHTVTTTPGTPTEDAIAGTVANPAGGTPASLKSQGFWGAIITRGGHRDNGDRYSPENNVMGPMPVGPNTEYDGLGYDYTVVLTTSGTVKIFDPTFCETGPIPSSGSHGAGDHWIQGNHNTPVTTVFTLFDEKGTPYDPSDDYPALATSGTLFANEIQSDQGGTMGTPPDVLPTFRDCSADPWHNHWWQIGGTLPAGRYRVNVSTADAGNTGTNAENGWSLWVSGGQVYGESRMVAYNNIKNGSQLFYLAQIGRSDAGKTMEISLFDPGDVGGDAFLRLRSPDGGTYNYATFAYSSDNGRAGSSSANVIQTASGGTNLYQNSVITLTVNLPSTYGASGLTPAGETQAGWWQVEYQVASGNDTTTWEVGLVGSPVHLVP